jgi:hypothetical protein
MEKEKLANYYKDLPEDFEVDYVIDAKDKKVNIILNVLAVVLMICVFLFTYWIKFYLVEKKQLFDTLADVELWHFSLSLLVFCVALIVYLILHELTHGLVYKAMTKQKLTFGLTFTVAYCGLKEGYVNRKTAILAILAPFVIYSILMIVAICCIPANLYSFWVITLFAVHFGGCVGDLFGSIILIFKYRGKQILMNDTGPKQSFYIKKVNN